MSIIHSMGGTCKGYKVDISKKEDVYKHAEEIRKTVGDVSIVCIFGFGSFRT